LRGTTPRRAVAYNRLKRSECAAKTNNISLADKIAAVRDPRRRGSDDVAGDAHVLDEDRFDEPSPSPRRGFEDQDANVLDLFVRLSAR